MYDVPHLHVAVGSDGGGAKTLRIDLVAKDDTAYSQVGLLTVHAWCIDRYQQSAITEFCAHYATAYATALTQVVFIRSRALSRDDV
jgi:hypothetical protein